MGVTDATMAIEHTFKVVSEEKVVAFVRHWNLYYHVRRRINFPVKAEP